MCHCWNKFLLINFINACYMDGTIAIINALLNVFEFWYFFYREELLIKSAYAQKTNKWISNVLLTFKNYWRAVPLKSTSFILLFLGYFKYSWLKMFFLYKLEFIGFHLMWLQQVM